MDLLLICGTPPYPLHEAQRALTYFLARELVNQRYMIDLVCFYDQPEDFAEIPRYESFFREIHLLPMPDFSQTPLRRRLNQASQHFPKNAELAWSAEMWKHIQERVSSPRYDLVQLVGDVDVYEYSSLVKGLPNLMVSVELPSERYGSQLIGSHKSGQKRQLRQQHDLLRQYERWMYQEFGTVAVSTPQQADHIKHSNSHVFTLPLGVDTDYYVPTGFEPRTPGLLFIGNFAHPTVAEAALRLCKSIFPTVQRTIPKATLFLVGPNPSDDLKTFESPSVVITGRVPDLRPYFELAGLFVSPLKQGAGFRQDILKALTMMTPVVASRPSCEGLDVTHEQDILIADSDDEFIRSIIHLLRDDQLRLRLQLNGRKQIQEHYSWQRVAAKYADLHRQIVR